LRRIFSRIDELHVIMQVLYTIECFLVILVALASLQIKFKKRRKLEKMFKLVQFVVSRQKEEKLVLRDMIKCFRIETGLSCAIFILTVLMGFDLSSLYNASGSILGLFIITNQCLILNLIGVATKINFRHLSSTLEVSSL
jgi:hypothetical protein